MNADWVLLGVLAFVRRFTIDKVELTRFENGASEVVSARINGSTGILEAVSKRALSRSTAACRQYLRVFRVNM